MDAKRTNHRRCFVKPQNSLWDTDSVTTKEPIDRVPTVVARIGHSHIIDSEVNRIMGLGRVTVNIVKTTSCPLHINVTLIE